MRIIGVTHSGYPTVRNISSLPFKSFKIEKKYDVFKFPEYITFKLTKKTIKILFNLHQDFGLSRCDIFHFFNTVSFSKTPWVTTFETEVPRFGIVPRIFTTIGVKLIAGKHCKKLIAISECAKEFELDFLRSKYPDYYDVIEKKIVVIYPPQKILMSDYSEKKLNATLSFITVGALFFLKGGMEILRVFDKLLSQGNNINLYIVSSMQMTYIGTEADYKEAMEIIRKHPDHIFYYNSLPNKEVLELFSKCHVALMTSYADTFGYSVLEAQALGCPVITTDIRALGEINNENCGWVIPVPKDKLGFAIINTALQTQEFRSALTKGLEEAITGIIENPGQIEKKGKACLERIKEKHSPEKNAQQLEEIYNIALVRSK